MAKRREQERWAEETFGHAQLGDARLSSRLVRVASDLAGVIGASPGRAAGDDDGAAEAAYRFVRNERVNPSAIAEAGFAATAASAQGTDKLLCVEDTSTLSFTHSVDGLGDVGGPISSDSMGLFVHSALLVDAITGATVGLAGQDYWMRDPAERGKRHQRNERDYRDKESFKWQRMSEALRERLGDDLARRVIAVCDREADVFEYLAFKAAAAKERFIVRASWDRSIEAGCDDGRGDAIDGHLFAVLGRARRFGESLVQVPQRGGRPARTANLTLRAQRIRLKQPHRHHTGDLPKRIGVNAVLASEDHPPSGVAPLQWLLLTTEPIATEDDVLDVLRMYRLRWRIEEFHKAWKSGAGVERRRMRSALNIERIAVILAFVAIRLLQLRERHDEDPAGSCTQMLTDAEWRVLWVSIEKRRPLRKPPTIAWAYRAIGRLGGWHDTKRTGRIGWESYWIGWLKLQERVEGYEVGKLLAGGL